MIRIAALSSLCLAAMASASPALADMELTFLDVTDTHLPQGLPSNTMDVEAADLNGDGLLDIVTAQEFLTNKILLNLGGGRFEDGSHLLPALSAAEMAGGPPQLNFPG